MGSVHIWLKRSYIVVISLTAASSTISPVYNLHLKGPKTEEIISLLLLGLTLFAHGYIHQQEEVDHEIRGIHFMYIVAVVIIVLTIFGAFGVWKEKKWALIVFAVGMILSSLFMLVVNIQGLVAQPKLAEDMKKQYRSLLPLVNATEFLNDIQTGLKCCGIEGYQDWKSNIPESCLCTEVSTNPCVAAPRNSSLFNGQRDGLPVMIYEKGCLQYLIETMMIAFRILFGMSLVLLLLWVLSIVLCIVILCQLDRNKGNAAAN